MGRFLVTGARGFLGSHLTSRLSASGLAFDPLSRETVRWPEGLSDLDLSPYTAVIHLAHAPVRQSSNEAALRRDNVEPLVRLAQAARRTNRDCGIVFVTSQSAKPGTASLYGRMKLEAEAVLREGPSPYVVLKPGLVVGRGDSGLFSKIAAVLRRSPVVPLVGDGRQLIQPVDVRTVAEALVASALSVGRLSGRTFPLALEPMPFRSLLEEAAAAMGRRPCFVPVPRGWVGAGLAVAERVLAAPPVTRASLVGLLELEPIPARQGIAELGLTYPDLKETLQAALSPA